MTIYHARANSSYIIIRISYIFSRDEVSEKIVRISFSLVYIREGCCVVEF